MTRVNLAYLDVTGKIPASQIPALPYVKASELFYDVRDYGAKGDGATDDTAAIQAALDAARAVGGVAVYLPPGVYLISSYLRIGSTVTLCGAGASSVLRLKTGVADTASADLLHNYSLNAGFPAPLTTPAAPAVAYLAGGGTLAAATYSYRVAAVNDQGETLASAAATAVATAGSARMVVTWLAIPGATSYNVFGRTAGNEQLLAQNLAALTFTDDGKTAPLGLVSDYNYTATRASGQDTDIAVLNLTLDGNKAGNPGLTASAGATYFNNVAGLTIRGVRVRDTTRHGLSMQWCTGINISGNVLTACGTAGKFTGIMLYYRCSGATISGNTLVGCGFGILTDHGTNNVSVTGNAISASADSAIGFDEGSYAITCSGNTCTGNGNAGITVTDGQTGRRTHDVSITGNVCTDNFADGIVLAGTDLFTVSGNVCARNGIGIRTAAGTTQPARRGHVSGNTVTDNLAQGIYLSAATRNVSVTGNRVEGNGAHGIEGLSIFRCAIKANDSSNNNSTNAAGFICGIKLSGTGADNVVVGNTCTNDVATFGQHAGIYLAGATNLGTQYGGNVVFNNQSNQFFSDTPANDVHLAY